MAMSTRKRGRRDREESEFPCIECGREVRQKQQGLECDICSRWQHRLCRTGVNLEEYRRAMRHGIEWNCEECLANQSLPTNEMTRLSGFDEGVFSSRSDLNDHMESVTEEMGESERSFDSFEPVHESTRMSLLTDESAAPNQHDEMPSALEEPSIHEELLEEQRPALDEEVQEEPSIHEELLEEQRPVLDEAVQVEESDEDEEGHELVTYQEIPGASQRAQPKLVDSRGYLCKASIRQAGGTYQPGLQPHIHQPAPGALHRVKMRKQVKQLSTRHLLKTGTAIAEDVMLNQHALQHAPKLESMARMANRKREQQRPKEPRSLQFDLKEQFVPG